MEREFKPRRISVAASLFLCALMALFAAGTLYGGILDGTPLFFGLSGFFALMALFIAWVSLKAHVTVYPDRLEYWRMGHKVVPWSRLRALAWVSEGRGMGVAGAMVPDVLAYQLDNGRGGNIPVRLMRDSQQLIALIDQHAPVQISR